MSIIVDAWDADRPEGHDALVALVDGRCGAGTWQTLVGAYHSDFLSRSLQCPFPGRAYAYLQAREQEELLLRPGDVPPGGSGVSDGVWHLLNVAAAHVREAMLGGRL